MRFGLASEAQMIRQIRQITAHQTAREVILSIGDDAAAFRFHSGYLMLVSTDALVEGVHFDFKYCAAEDVGWKALAVNLSDIAAMGGKPLYVTTSLALPREVASNFVPRFYRGLMALARQHAVALIGGDTCRSPRGVFIDVTIIGAVKSRNLLTRQGAKPGDLIYVTGELGGSAIGLELLSKLKSSTPKSAIVRRHLRPIPRCNTAHFLAERRLASAMIDLSDGLSTDLGHICEESRVGGIVEVSRIPVPKTAARQKELAETPLHYALHGGEDYELLFTVPSRLSHRIPKQICEVPVHQIGRVTRARGMWLMDGHRKQRFQPRGFAHFDP